MQNMPYRSSHLESEASIRLHEDRIHKIKNAVYKHKDVEALYLSFTEDGLVDYWILVPQRSLGATRRLIEDQQAIIRQFAQMADPGVHLDFHIIYRNGRNPQELVPTGARLIPR